MSLPHFVAGGSPPTAKQLNGITGELAQRGKLFAAPPLYLTDGPGGSTLTFSDNEFWAVVCCPNADGSYLISEVAFIGGGTPVVMEGGRQASGWNLSRDFVNPGTVTRVYPGFGGEFVFLATEQSPRITDYCPSCDESSSSSSSSSQSSSSPSSSSPSSTSPSSSSPSPDSSSGVSSSSDSSSGSPSSSSPSSSSPSASSPSASSPSASSPSASSPSASSGSSGSGCGCDGETIQVVTGIACVGGNLEVTYTTICLPPGSVLNCVPSSSTSPPTASSHLPQGGGDA